MHRLELPDEASGTQCAPKDGRLGQRPRGVDTPRGLHCELVYLPAAEVHRAPRRKGVTP
jgi:hypothetical protein